MKENMEQDKMKLYDYLQTLGKFKVLFLVIKTLFNKNLPIEPIMLDTDNFKTDIGFIIPIK